MWFTIFSFTLNSSLVLAQPIEFMDLSDQFNSIVPKQTGGSCHVYAETALVEAACYRLLGRKIDISEGALFEYHILNEILDHGKPSVRANDPQRFPGVNIISGKIDGSIESGVTAKRILNGSACLENEFAAPKKTLDQIQMLIAQLDEYATSSKRWLDADEIVKTEAKSLMSQQEALTKEKQVLDKWISATPIRTPTDLVLVAFQKIKKIRIEKQIDSINNKINQGLEKYGALASEFLEKRESEVYQTIVTKLKQDIFVIPKTDKTSTLHQCLSKNINLESSSHVTPEKIIKLLINKKPVLCTGNIQNIGWHETMIVGYRKKKNGVVEYLLRDSYLGTLTWDLRVYCDEILWISN